MEQNIKTSIISFRGFQIHLAEQSHCALIYKGNTLIKCIAGNVDENIIWSNGKFANNRIEKSSNYIINL
jgi:hypothetical protein